MDGLKTFDELEQLPEQGQRVRITATLDPKVTLTRVLTPALFNNRIPEMNGVIHGEFMNDKRLYIVELDSKPVKTRAVFLLSEMIPLQQVGSLDWIVSHTPDLVNEENSG